MSGFVVGCLMSFMGGLVTGCKEEAKLVEPPTPPTLPEPAPIAPEIAKSEPSAISEDDFKKLHKLKGEKPVTLNGEMIEVGNAKAYLSVPAMGKPPFPAVLLVHEWWGLNDNIKLWADRLAGLGYAALAVDLYGGQLAGDADTAAAKMKAVDEKKAVSTLLVAHRFLSQDKRVQADKRAVMGWCFGGGMALQVALNANDLDGAVIYYGNPVTDPKQLKKIGSTRVLGIYGNLDSSIPPNVVNEFDEALTKAGVNHTIYRYDAVHAFANPSNAKYDEQAAADAWAHAQAFLATVLKGQRMTDKRSGEAGSPSLPP